MVFSNRQILFVMLSLAALLVACGGAETKGGDSKAKVVLIDDGPSSRYPVEGLEVESADVHGEGRATIWKIYSNEKENIDDAENTIKLVRKEVDSNADGNVDVWFHYNSLEKLFREEADTDFDEHIDTVSYYEAGKIVKREKYVLGYDLAVATSFFRDGQVYKVEMDTDRDGDVDRWEIYQGLLLTQIGIDRDGDGRVDEWQARD